MGPPTLLVSAAGISGNAGQRSHWTTECGYCDASGDFLVQQETANGVTGLCTATKPVLDSLGVQLNFRRLFKRIVRPYDLDKTPIAGTALVGYHDAVTRH